MNDSSDAAVDGQSLSRTDGLPIMSIERRGIEYIPDGSRWGRPANLFWMWAGAVWNVAFVLNGALGIVIFKLSFIQAVAVIVAGNLFYVVTGLASLQGPQTGTTTFTISRASFGPNGNRLPSFFNWVTLVGYEIVGVTIIVLAALAITTRAGFHAGTPAEVVYIAVAVIIQAVLPTLGHTAILRVLRWLAVPFAVLFVIMAVLTVPKVATQAAPAGTWGSMLVFLAIVISGGGLSWTGMANDYSRYLPPTTARWRIVLAVALGGAIPSVLLEILGAAVATGAPGATTVESLTAGFPNWFIVPFLVVVMLQFFASNTLNLYSSGVTLQSLVSPIKRLQCVAIDTIICGGLAAYTVLSSRFFGLLSDFLLFTITWLAPWCAIFLVDAWLRRNHYAYDALLNERGGRYFRWHGVHLPAVIALIVGGAAATVWLNAYPPYVGPLASRIGGSDLSVPLGLLCGGGMYWLLASRSVRSEGRGDDHVGLGLADY